MHWATVPKIYPKSPSSASDAKLINRSWPYLASPPSPPFQHSMGALQRDPARINSRDRMIPSDRETRRWRRRTRCQRTNHSDRTRPPYAFPDTVHEIERLNEPRQDPITTQLPQRTAHQFGNPAPPQKVEKLSFFNRGRSGTNFTHFSFPFRTHIIIAFGNPASPASSPLLDIINEVEPNKFSGYEQPTNSRIQCRLSSEQSPLEWWVDGWLAG